jgi:hypothetical protein
MFVVEQNRDAQLRSLLTLETASRSHKLHSILHYSGLPMTSKEIVEGRAAELGDARAPCGCGRTRRSGAAPRRLRLGEKHVLHQQAEGPPPRPAEERARPHAPRLRGRDVDALRRLRPRLDHRRLVIEACGA